MPFGEPHPQEGNQTVHLSPDLARSNPDIFKRVLLQRIGQNPRVAPILAGLESLGMISQDSLLLRDSWVSETRRNTPGITLGFQEITPDMQDAIFYTGSPACPRRYEQQLVYRFTHELTHKYIDLLLSAEHPFMMQLLEYSANVRVDSQVGLTPFGHIDNQEHPLKRAEEDVTELLNMYMYDPQYFADYLNMLAHPSAQSLREQYGLAGLTPDSSYQIARLVESVITSPYSSA